MDDQNNLTGNVIDIGRDLVDERPKQLLAGAHCHLRTCPSRLQIVGEAGKIGNGLTSVGGLCGAQPRFALLNAA